MEKHNEPTFSIEKELMDFSDDPEKNICEELAKNIRYTLDQELLYNLCIMSGWGGATVSYDQLDEIKEWTVKNSTGDVKWFDNRVAFQQEKDWEWFMLRWQ